MDIRNFFGNAGKSKSSSAAAANVQTKDATSNSSSTLSASALVAQNGKETKSSEMEKPESNFVTKPQKNSYSKADKISSTKAAKSSPKKAVSDKDKKMTPEQENKNESSKKSLTKSKPKSKQKVKDDFINDDDDEDDDSIIIPDDDDFHTANREKENKQKAKESEPRDIKSVLKNESMMDIFSDEAEEEIVPTKRKRSNTDKDFPKSPTTPNASKGNRPSSSRKRKKEEAPVSDVDDEEVSGVKKKPSKKKKKPEPKAAVILDSGSDEEPLPEKLRKSPAKKNKKLPQPDESTQTIADAFTKASLPSEKQKPSSVPKKPQNVEQRKEINANDFFGSAPVHRLESRDALKETSTNKANSTNEASNSGQRISEKLAEKLKQDTVSNKQTTTNNSTILSSNDTIKSEPVAKKMKEEPVKSSDQVIKSPPKSTAKSPVKSPKKTSPVSKMVVTPQRSEKTSSKSSPVKSAKSVETGQVSSPVPSSTEKPKLQSRNSGYFAFKHREPPKCLGTRQLPEGADNCLEGVTFVMTGILESFERDEVKAAIERLGGKVTTNVSKNTKYLLVGRDAGESKITKAQQLGTTQLDEDGLIELIKSLPGKKSKYEIAAEKEAAAIKKAPHPVSGSANSSQTFVSTTSTQSPHSSKEHSQVLSTPGSKTYNSMITPNTSQSSKWSVTSSQMTESPDVSTNIRLLAGESLMWVDKYKPSSLKQIIGQQGDKSNARKLLQWLTSWRKNLGRKPVFGRTSDDGAGYKAALLSGPPGVGKTTTAQLVCMEAGFSFIELNASDTRSKRSLQEEVAEALNNHTLVDFFGAGRSKSQPDGQRHCLVMDEVDGMAGNEDRGGMQELILLIKNSKIPVICMCNDRNNPKIRSLSNYCFDLRFQRPRLEQIKAAMMSLAFKEGLKIPPAAMNDIIQAANQDIRQVIHNLSMWTAKDKSLTYEQLKIDAAKAQKDLHFGPFDVCRKVFAGGEETARMTLIDKSDLFFHDYSIGPLFVQENYASVNPFSAKGNVAAHLKCMSLAADSIATGDLFDAGVRKGNNWSLLPTQAMFASVLPGEAMRGSIGGMIQFPSWLGKNSTTNKNSRLLQELGSHMCLNISANKRSLNLDYLPTLRTALTQPLLAEGVEGVGRVVSLMAEYDLLREDFDSIMELTTWPGSKDPMSQLDSKVKAAFTRTYNKESHLTPYAPGVTVGKKGGKRGGGGVGEDELELGEGDVEGQEGGEEQQSDEEDNDDVTKDAMIKQKKATSKNAKSTADVASATSQGKGKTSAKNPTGKNSSKRGGKK